MEFDEFFDAFGGESAVEEPAAEEQPETVEEPGQDEPETPAQEEGSEPAGEGGEEENQEGASEPAGEPGGTEEAKEQTFTVPVGDEERQLSLEETISLASKGALYDDLQAQLNTVSQERDNLQGQLSEQQEVMDILAQIAEKYGKDTKDLARQFYVNVRKNEGITEHEASMELEFAKLKKQVNAEKPAPKEEPKQESDGSDRAKREYAEFQQLYPGVRLDDSLVEKLKGDVQKGMSLANAYQKMLNDQKAAELAEQERKQQAAEQNRRNRASSPGSQQDSGGRREKSGFDDFFDQFK